MKTSRIIAFLSAVLAASWSLSAQQSGATASADSTDIELFRIYEAKIRHQPIPTKRFSKGDALTVGALLETILTDGGASAETMTVNAIHKEGEDSYVITGKGGVFNFDIAEAMLEKDANGEYNDRKSQENLVLTIHNGSEASLVLHIRCHRCTQCAAYFRVSLIAVGEEPFTSSLMVVYDLEDNAERLAELAIFEEEAIDAWNNNTESIDQYVYVSSCRERFTLDFYAGSGLNHVQHSEWFDAYTDFSRLMTFTRDSVCIYGPMLTALEHLDNPIEKNYFEGLIAWSEGKDYLEDDFLTKMKTPDKDLTVGYTLETLFNVPENSVTGMSLFQKKGKKYTSSTLDDQGNIWSTKISDICSGDATAVFRYSRDCSDLKDVSDSSSSCWANTIVLRSEPLDKGATMVSIMIPNFIGDDDKHDLTLKSNTPVFQTFTLRNGKQSILNEIHDETIKILEAIKADKVTKETLFSCYNIGYDFNDFGLYNKSIPFLNVARYTLDKQCIIEFINGLVNSGDPRALEFIDAYLAQVLQQDPDGTTLRDLNRFLNRRKAYTLIELDRLEEAKNVLRTLLWDPETKEYAEGELEYIRSLEEDQ
ncbi:MAG: tetratricopeptide repeat protein [Bacteroidales bacterium]|nr:tetratricopeptide repeat protein [Candidatus Cryptobacteroides caccocaballi]